jgi:hypothetical protein
MIAMRSWGFRGTGSLWERESRINHKRWFTQISSHKIANSDSTIIYNTYRHNPTKQGMITTRLDKHHPVRGSMRKKSRIRTGHNKIIKSTRPFDPLDNFMTSRTSHRATIRDQVLKNFKQGRVVQRMIHNNNMKWLGSLLRRKLRADRTTHQG